MRSPARPAIVAAELCTQGVAITFDDHTSTIFPTNLLHASRNLAAIMIEESGDAQPL